MSTPQPIRVAPDLSIVSGIAPAAGQQAVGIWLLGVAFMCFAIAVIGAITRLTESGLSMVEWKPLLQDIPPLSQSAWQHVFDLYKQSPQYRLVTNGMTLAEFKGIFWWEWTHRLVAQLIGVSFALPFLWLSIRRRLSKRLAPYLIGLFALGGLQGLLGWLMVASGLVDRPSVSQYRLAAHLSLDLTIYALTLWTAFFVFRPRGAGLVTGDAASALRHHAVTLLSLLAVTIVWGALTAGLRGGLLYNTFPLMGGGIAPPDFFAQMPWWSNFTENPGAVQFVHRVLAITAGLTGIALALRLRLPGLAAELQQVATVLFAVVLLQIGLGIATVLSHVPVWLGALHQANAIVLLGVVVRVLFLLRPAPTAQFRPRLIVT